MVCLPESGTAGGSFQLDELIEDHGEALLFDLQRYCGINLLDVFRAGSGLTPRRVLWLVGQLPPDSAFSASVRGGPEFRPWTPELHLLSAVVNLLNAANRQRAGKRGGKPIVKPPTAQRQKATRVLTVAEIAARQQKAAADAHSQTTYPEVIDVVSGREGGRSRLDPGSPGHERVP